MRFVREGDIKATRPTHWHGPVTDEEYRAGLR